MTVKCSEKLLEEQECRIKFILGREEGSEGEVE